MIEPPGIITRHIPATTDEKTIVTKYENARNALRTNRAHINDTGIQAYLDNESPTASQTVDAVKELLRQSQKAARQRNGIIRLLLGQFDGTD